MAEVFKTFAYILAGVFTVLFFYTLGERQGYERAKQDFEEFIKKIKGKNNERD